MTTRVICGECATIMCQIHTGDQADKEKLSLCALCLDRIRMESPGFLPVQAVRRWRPRERKSA